jgi:hypothetical protein
MDIKEVYIITEGMAYLQKKLEENPDMKDSEVLDLNERMETLRVCLIKALDKRGR